MNACTSNKTLNSTKEQILGQKFTTLHEELTKDLLIDESYEKIKKSCEKAVYKYKPGRSINPKMITKLISWLELLCKNAFHFSMKTLQAGIKILLKYVTCYDENYQQLQLVGCVVLHIASKVTENFVISQVCYCESALNSFNEEQFHLKQQQILLCLSQDINFPTFNGVIDYFHTKLKLEDGHVIQLKVISEQLMKKEQVWALPETDVLLTLITILKIEGKLFPIPELLQLFPFP